MTLIATIAFLRLLILYLTSSVLETSAYDDRTLRGAGASFPNKVYQSWVTAYQSERQKWLYLTSSYDAIGSGNGRKRIKSAATSGIDYAGSDSLLKKSDYEENPDLQMFPSLIGAVVVAYNLGKTGPVLNISREGLVGIYNGTIKWWNDTILQDDNPSMTLPLKKIQVIVRKDKSGTTEIFTSALSAFSPDWSATYGTFSKGVLDDGTMQWPENAVTYTGKKNIGVTGLVLSIENTIAYVSQADAVESNAPIASIETQTGEMVQPTVKSVQEAAVSFIDAFTSRFTAVIVDPPSSYAYPISGYTYIIVQMSRMQNCDSAKELLRYCHWFLHDIGASRIATQFGFAPVGDRISNMVTRRVLKRLTCRGTNVWTEVQKEKRWEEIAEEQKWRIPLYIAVPLVSLVLIGLMTHSVYSYVKTNRALMRNEWMIDQEKIEITEKRVRSNYSVSVMSDRLSKGMFAGEESLTSYLNNITRATYLDNEVFLRNISLESVSHFTRETKKLLLWMQEGVHHPNVMTFYGVTKIKGEYRFVSEFCSKGSMVRVLEAEKYTLDESFKFALAINVANGLLHLHKLGIIHGRLCSAVCFVDTQWNVKIADWEFNKLNTCQKKKRRNQVFPESPSFMNEAQRMAERYKEIFSSSPQKIRSSSERISDLYVPSKADDIYSYSIITYEIFTRKVAFESSLQEMTEQEVLFSIANKKLRPRKTKHVPDMVFSVLEMCWKDEASERLNASQTYKKMKLANPSKHSLLDSMMRAVETYTVELEDRLNEKSGELAQVTNSLEQLLGCMLPEEIAFKLAKGESVQPEYFDCVTVFFSNIVGFTSIATRSTPHEVVKLLNILHTLFDSIIEKHDAYKVEIMGDSHMVVSGAPKRNGESHVVHVANMALEIIDGAQKFRIPHLPDKKLLIRCGIHSGAVMAGVVGLKMPRYCLFGDTVTTALQVELTALPQRIQISNVTNEMLTKQDGGFITKFRGEVEIKGKGNINTFWLLSKVTDSPDDKKENLADLLD